MTSPFQTTRPLTQPTEGARLIDRDSASWLGLTCHARNLHEDRQFDRVRHGKPHPRLTAPRIVAEIESAVRDERVAA